MPFGGRLASVQGTMYYRSWTPMNSHARELVLLQGSMPAQCNLPPDEGIACSFAWRTALAADECIRCCEGDKTWRCGLLSDYFGRLLKFVTSKSKAVWRILWEHDGLQNAPSLQHNTMRIAVSMSFFLSDTQLSVVRICLQNKRKL